MSTRAYDYIVQVDDSSSFMTGNTVLGTITNASAEIISIEDSNLKVRMNNVYSEFLEGEALISQSAVMLSSNIFIDLSDSIDGTTNTFPINSNFVLPDSIQVYADDFLVSKDRYVYNSNDTITFKNSNSLAQPNSVSYEERVFPGTDINRLILQVVTANTESISFVSSNLTGYVETASANIESIYSAPYIAEKNSTQQTPLIKLYTIYYPGEWYPANEAGNPTKTGEGFAWPYSFPIRYAEVVGETFNDFNYYISFGGKEYKVVALSSSDISLDISSTVNSISLDISNFDGAIATTIENSNILGFNSSNSTIAHINGELVQNIDPRTVVSNIHFNESVASSRGINAVWDYSSTISHGDYWTPLKSDSRDLLGGVVEIKLSYAKFLDYWPEYSTVKLSTSNSVQVYSSAPYRVGDTVTSNSNNSFSTVQSIKGNNVYFSSSSLSFLGAGSKLLIVNPDADKNSYIENRFIINRLSELNDAKASFELTNWLQNFKAELPKRKFYTTTCSWKYKSAECKYPTNGSSEIIGSNPPVSANGFFTYNNETTINSSEDVCSKTITACRLRRNLVNFGGFPGVREE
jgi:lambda family phage minor tail protein L